jgi:uncharacterized membrane protein
MRRSPLVSILIFIALVLLFPFVLGPLVGESLHKLHLSKDMAIFITAGVLVGSFINFPLYRIARDSAVPVDPLAHFGVSGFMQRWQSETIIAVNLGGCIIPLALALYELTMLDQAGLRAAGIASLVNIIVCFFIARPVPGVGILIPGLIPPAVAAATAILLARQDAPAVAFIAGVSGVLIGADVFHLRDITRAPIGVASIGGAGSFDGIVLSGIIAAYLA